MSKVNSYCENLIPLFTWSHHEFSICFAKWSWIHNLLCKFTFWSMIYFTNSFEVDILFLHTDYEFTFSSTYELTINPLFLLEFTMKPLSYLRIHHGSTIYFANVTWIYCLLSILTKNLLSASWIHNRFAIREFPMKPLSSR